MELGSQVECVCIKAAVKLTWSQPGPLVVLVTDTKAGTVGVEFVPELVSTKALSREWEEGTDQYLKCDRLSSHYKGSHVGGANECC